MREALSEKAGVKHRPETIKAQDQDSHPGLGLCRRSGWRESNSHYPLGKRSGYGCQGH